MRKERMENAVPTWANRVLAWLKRVDEAMHYDPIDEVRSRLPALEQRLEPLERRAFNESKRK